VGTFPVTRDANGNNPKVTGIMSDHLSYRAFGVPVTGTIPATTGTTITTISTKAGVKLTKDDCCLDDDIHDLDGANDDCIDYSPSYYDRTCVGETQAHMAAE